jgi:hypothetical protein
MESDAIFLKILESELRGVRFRSGRVENAGFREPERSVLKVREHRKRGKPTFAGWPHLNISAPSGGAMLKGYTAFKEIWPVRAGFSKYLYCCPGVTVLPG